MNSRGRRRHLAWERWILSGAVGLLALAILAPFLWLLSMSVKSHDDIFALPPRLLFTPTFENYRALWDTAFGRSFANSAVVSVASTALAMVIGVPGAYALSRAQFRATGQLNLWILASRMAPPIAFTIPYFLAYRHLGLVDTRSGLVIIYLTFNLSLVVWLMRSFFDATPRALEEAAWMDGASHRQAFLRIVLPVAGPGLAATGILCFLYSWNDFFFALILTRTEAMTAPVAIVNFMNYEGWEWGRIAAGGTLVMLPVLLFAILVRNFLVRGLTAGAIKG